MPEENEVSEQEAVDVSKQIEKEEMTSFLTSTGKIKEELAVSLYKGGLDSWQKLIEGTEDYFVGFKGIGPAKSKLLVELGQVKKGELEATVPGLKEVLESIPRVTQRTISLLLENGYDSFESFKDKTEKDLEEIKGIGPKMSEAIIKAIHDHIEKYDAEEATGEVVEEEEKGPSDERSLIQRIIDTIAGFFGGKKEEKAEEPVETPEVTETEEKEEVPEDKEKEPEPEEEKEVPIEEPVETPEVIETEEEKPEEGSSEEKEEKPEEGTEAEEEPPKEEKGFFVRIKETLFGGSKKEEPKKEEEPVEADVTKEEAPPDEEPVEEPPAEEAEEEQVKDVIQNFEDIPGVSKKTAGLLRNAGYLGIEELKEAVPEDLTMIDGIGPKTAEKICKALCD